MGHHESSAKRKAAYKKKVENPHTSVLTAHLKALQQKDSPRRSRRQEIIKLRTDINKIETKKTSRMNQQHKELVI